MKKLPIGIQTFQKIRDEGYAYVDKTRSVFDLVNSGNYFFLSRPRRFGKSLFLDTLAEAFSANKRLFEGLYLENNWDWSKQYPIVRIDLGASVVKSPERLLEFLHEILSGNEQAHGVKCGFKSLAGRFNELISLVYKKHGSVVILVDEYDKPILDNLGEKGVSVKVRDILRDFYSVIKSADAMLKLVFLTGVSKFSKVSLFSGLNNLEDITLTPAFATICGYTHSELETVFSEWLVEAPMAEVKAWYNGYSFLGESVYNPFDVLLYLKNREFRNYWFETGTPTFLVDLLREKQFFMPRLEKLYASEALISSFDVEAIAPEALLFQTGYLTIIETIQTSRGRTFLLGYPNHEVEVSLNEQILSDLTRMPGAGVGERVRCENALLQGRIDELKEIFHSLFAAIPHDWYRKNDLSDYEGYYASIFYSFLRTTGFELIAEDVTNHGRIDLTLIADEHIYLFEFKVKSRTGDVGQALAQLLSKKYHEKYLRKKKPVYLVGVEFDPETRNIDDFSWQPAPV